MKNHLLKRIFRKIKRLFRPEPFFKLMMKVCRILPLQNKIVFSSQGGLYFSDSPLAIFEEMRARGLKYCFVCLSKNADQQIEGAKTVRLSSLAACYHLATARVWVDNKRKPAWVRKKKGQFYVQTWHSGIGNKKVEKYAEDKLSPQYLWRAKNDSKMADLFISGSKWQTELYRNAFWYDGEILESGLPRSDVLFRSTDSTVEKVYKYFSVPQKTRLILYAPTFRDKYYKMDVYNLDYQRVICTMQKCFGGEWKVLVRLHPNVAKRHTEFHYDTDVLDASMYPEINELIVASEWLITDYSSCVFDAAECGKRAVLYASDLKEYAEARGFYWPFDQLPFYFAETNDDLINYIEHFDEAKYEAVTTTFIEQFGIFDDGKASERVVDRILEAVKE